MKHASLSYSWPRDRYYLRSKAFIHRLILPNMCGYAFWDAEGAPPHMNIYVLNSSVNSHVRFKIFAIAYWSFMLCRSIFPSFSKQTLSANLFLCMCPLIQFDVWTPFVIIHYRITVHDLKIQLIWHKLMLLHLLHKILPVMKLHKLKPNWCPVTWICVKWTWTLSMC